MGLIEKRLVKQGQDEWVPLAQTELRELTGGSQVYEVEWDTFQAEAIALNNVQYQALRRINSAFRLICCDDLGKEAVNEKVTTVRLRNVATLAAKTISLEANVLLVAGAFGKGSDGYFGDIELKQAIEKLI